ncbi:MAG: hypothetical protein IJA59_00340, partial [Clostridia bacterium]|nr:hypothetical protein [Clostridia bacterium]
PRKPVFGWLVSAGLSKKSLNPSVQVNLPIGFRLFLYPLRGCDGCAIGLPRLLTASARGGFTIVPPQRHAFPLVFPQKKRRCPNAPRTKAAVCGAQLRARAKHAEKETGENRGKLACIRFLRFLFRYRLPRQLRSQLPMPTQVLCYFLDSRK